MFANKTIKLNKKTTNNSTNQRSTIQSKVKTIIINPKK